ncbi:MAG: tail fiber domain-containing protein, partial [Candidatus Omnitrophica bacterium]|nr:tail fiber domain-containing protein [Candidatus Omnitrophota bacterium]
ILLASVAFAEDITITTYYPSPYGSYNGLFTDKLGVGDNNSDGSFTSADVPTTAGQVWINGNVGIKTGVVSPSYPLQLNGEPAANGYTLWTNYSDRRLKENIVGLENGIMDKIMKLKPSAFDYNDKYYQLTGYSKDGRKLYGFVAQEMQEVFPEMVKEQQLGKETYLDTNLTNLQVYLVKAIQEQQDLIKEQQLEINALKARLDKLEEK